MQRILFFILCWVPLALADDSWENFTNNLATDLVRYDRESLIDLTNHVQAPLITLFGERLTKQFLSESISLLDNVIFALSPLGVLTAVVSLIRVCGGSSLRAFIGRAQEGPAEAESELLPCVSESTAELFNDGGISRVFGRPKVLEIIAWEDVNAKTGEAFIEIGTLRDALTKGAWRNTKDGARSPFPLEGFPELDMPNLSLNKGIKRRDQFWFYCAAVIGTVLQIGKVLREHLLSCVSTNERLRRHYIRCTHGLRVPPRFQEERPACARLRLSILHHWNKLHVRWDVLQRLYHRTLVNRISL